MASLPAAPTVRDHGRDVVNDIWANSAMVASDMSEARGGAHYNSHADLDIYHWTSIRGYATSGASLQDPAANSTALSSAWDQVQPYFSMSSTSTRSFMTHNGITRGIVW